MRTSYEYVPLDARHHGRLQGRRPQDGLQGRRQRHEQVSFPFWCCQLELYRGELKGLYVLLSRTQAGPGRAVKHEQDENSRNHVQAFLLVSVH